MNARKSIKINSAMQGKKYNHRRQKDCKRRKRKRKYKGAKLPGRGNKATVT